MLGDAWRYVPVSDGNECSGDCREAGRQSLLVSQTCKTTQAQDHHGNGGRCQKKQMLGMSLPNASTVAPAITHNAQDGESRRGACQSRYRIISGGTSRIRSQCLDL